jgi:hypothetical protein
LGKRGVLYATLVDQFAFFIFHFPFCFFSLLLKFFINDPNTIYIRIYVHNYFSSNDRRTMNILAISIGENYVKRSSSLEGQIII